MSRWDTGPGRLTCDTCGRDFDPIGHVWRFCGLTWPWHRMRLIEAKIAEAKISDLTVGRVSIGSLQAVRVHTGDLRAC